METTNTTAQAKTRHHFTDKDNKIIIKNVKKNPSNLKASFEKSAKTIGTSRASVQNHYYKYIAPSLYTTGKTDLCFSTLSSEQIYPGYKNNKRGRRPSKHKPLNVFQTYWNRILKLIKFN